MVGRTELRRRKAGEDGLEECFLRISAGTITSRLCAAKVVASSSLRAICMYEMHCDAVKLSVFVRDGSDEFG
jgi:hypothetical protein